MRHLPIVGTNGRTTWVAAVLVAVLAGFGLTSAPPAQAAGPYDWAIQSEAASGTAVHEGVGSYRLVSRSKSNPDVLAYGARDYGINLVWDWPSGQTNIRFERLAGNGDVRYNDRVAIYVQGGGYLKYGSRDNGINLVWSNTPAYEWEIIGGTPGQVVRTGAAVGLRNTAIQRLMVYGERSRGINLVWY